MEKEKSGQPVITRRGFLTAAAGAAVIAAMGQVLPASSTAAANTGFTLMPLPYPGNALEPHISSTTLSFHYGKHHRAYVEKINKLIKGTNYEKMQLEEIILKTAGKSGAEENIFNNAAQVWNHDFYWRSMRPGGGKPPEKLLKRIEADFGSFEDAKKELAEASKNKFGSGYAWLVVDKGKLKAIATDDADVPFVRGMKPLLTIDIWEHAYYLDYQNSRAAYVDALVDNLINWEFAAGNMA